MGCCTADSSTDHSFSCTDYKHETVSYGDSEYTFLQEIGKGGFSTVVHVKDGNGQSLACKVLRKPPIKNRFSCRKHIDIEDRRHGELMYHAEVEMLKKIESKNKKLPYIPHVIANWETQRYLYMIMPLYEG